MAAGVVGGTISTITPPDVIFYSSEEISPRPKRDQLDFSMTWTDEKDIEADIKEEELKADTAHPEAEAEDSEGPPGKKVYRTEEVPSLEPIAEELRARLPGWTRGDRMAAILLREETQVLIRMLPREDSPDSLAGVIGAFLLRSKENLHTFADLVSEDLLSVHSGRLLLTPLALRFMEQISSLE